MEMYKEHIRHFLGKDHRMKEEGMEKQFNEEVKQGWRFASDSAIITDENASEDCKAKKMEAGKDTKRKIAGWSTKMLEEVANRQDYEDTEERRQRRHIRQEGTNELWKELCGKMEEEVLEKCKVEEIKKDAYKGRGEPLKWPIVKQEKRDPPRKWSEDCWANFSQVQRILYSVK